MAQIDTCYYRHQTENNSIFFRLAYLRLILAHSRGQLQGRAQFDCKYLLNGDTFCKRYYCHQPWAILYAILIVVFTFLSWPILKVKVKHISIANISKTMIFRVDVLNVINITLDNSNPADRTMWFAFIDLWPHFCFLVKRSQWNGLTTADISGLNRTIR